MEEEIALKTLMTTARTKSDEGDALDDDDIQTQIEETQRQINQATTSPKGRPKERPYNSPEIKDQNYTNDGMHVFVYRFSLYIQTG